MARLEEITVGTSVKGVLPDGLVTAVAVEWIGSVAINLTYRESSGRLGSELLYRDREPTLEIAAAGQPWSFDGDGALFRLVSEAHRIRLAYLFDPLLAVHTSLVEPLPHQITAVYGEMLPRQPLRFLLADDPGAGKTIMTGLFVKELLVRGDLQRCLIVCPGNLAEQWQDELDRRFHLPFDIMTNDALEAARTGNWFLEHPLVICRLDKLSRDIVVQASRLPSSSQAGETPTPQDAERGKLIAKLQQTDWDLVVCDEAHKLNASYFGNEVKYTKRYRLGQLLSTLTRHFLLLTATPHNGKEADFQLFLALLDGDRFEGKFRDGVHTVNAADLMRRLIKEQLLKFDATPLFPERRAYTVNYSLSDPEAELYKSVTDYVREEFNRAEALENEGRKGTVGFALTILQRRLASSPEAIYQSLRRRRERLEKRLREEQLLKRGADASLESSGLPVYSLDDLDDLDDAPDAEVEEAEEKVVDQATAARNIAELKTDWTAINLRNDLQHYQEGLFMIDVPTFSEGSVREAILNAVAHRDYRHQGSVFIRQYARRIEVVSPGGFPPGITPDNILDQQLPRNRRIAESFARCGLVERSGQGANRMFEESVTQSKPLPDYSRSGPFQVWLTLAGQVQDPAFLRFLERIGRERLARFDTHDFVVLSMIGDGRPVPEGYLPRTANLIEQGVIERVGRRKFILSKRFYTFIGRKGTYTHKKGLDRETQKALLVKHIEESGSEGTPLQELMQVLPNLSRDQIQTLVRELKAAGRIHNVGATRSARWFKGPGSTASRPPRRLTS